MGAEEMCITWKIAQRSQLMIAGVTMLCVASHISKRKSNNDNANTLLRFHMGSGIQLFKLN